MPLNTLRLNHAPSSHPNERIVFIKPIPRPPSEKQDQETADIFLRAIAAQCLPIMKSHHLSVTTLEEYEPNPEFIGRNFNNGEIIQLVLMSKNGGWVPFNMVQMVMMHELAHNLHMNHGKGFWETRNLFSGEMRGLWDKGYTGEGFWGGGRCLGDLKEVVGNNTMTAGELGDVQVCGGTFRSRRRKRRRGAEGPDLTWKEKRDRRIEKKFGKNGQSVGEDEEKRMALEMSKKGPIGGKPRVAQSKRGRELRAAAALARFDTNKKEAEDLGRTGVEDSEDEYEEADVKGEDARDSNGQRMLDSMGFGMVRVCEDECEDEDGDDAHVKQEMAELEGLDNDLVHADSDSKRAEACDVHKGEVGGRNADPLGPESSAAPTDLVRSTRKRNPLYDIPEYQGSPTPPSSPGLQAMQKAGDGKKPEITIRRLHAPPISAQVGSAPTPPDNTPAVTDISTRPNNHSSLTCPICTLSNDRLSPTCLVCAHVLDPVKDPRHWRCVSEACCGSLYVNAGDTGICGVCGQRRTI